MRVPSSQLDGGKPDPTIVTSNEFREALSPADGLAASDSGKRKVQVVRHRLEDTEWELNRDVFGGSLLNPSLQPSYRSCVHYELPLRSASSVVFVDKALSVSLLRLERAAQPVLYTSTLSVRLGGSSHCRYAPDTKPARPSGVHRRQRATKWSGHKRSGQERGSGQCAGPRSKRQETNGKDKTGLSETRHHGSILGFSSSRGPRPFNTTTGRQKGNADEAVQGYTFSPDPESTTWSMRTVTENTETPSCHTEPPKLSTLEMTRYHSRQKDGSTDGTLSLKEALELFRPDFISRSQGRVRRLEQRARRRRGVLQDAGQGPERTDHSKPKPNCTTPDPLSDNLFKPRERSISGREMQLRSRRIYNKLPEVTKKKEEEKKRAVSQTNRLRAEVFKKRLLDQILQR